MGRIRRKRRTIGHVLDFVFLESTAKTVCNILISFFKVVVKVYQLPRQVLQRMPKVRLVHLLYKCIAKTFILNKY